MADFKVVKAWLELPVEEKDYWAGLTLLEKYSGKLHLVTQLRRNNTFSNLDRIQYELSLIAEVEYTPLQQVDPRDAVLPLGEAPSADSPSPLLDQLLKARAAKYGERNAISDTLADLEGEALAESTQKVVAIDDEIIALTTQIDYVEKHGKLPEPATDLTKDLESLQKEKKSLGEKISRLKGVLKKTPGNLEKQAEMDRLVAEREQVELQIKAFTTK